MKTQQLKPIVLTGGATGIGLATAQELLRKGGYKLLILGRHEEHLQESQKILGEWTHDKSELLTLVPCDLRQTDQIESALEQIKAWSPFVYGLINNAGIYPFGGLASTELKDWDDTMNVNLKAPFLLAQGLLPSLIKSRDGARIINIASTAGLLPNHFALAYSVSKAALVHMTRTLAKELGKDRITVNAICPGIVKTPMHEAYHNNQTELHEFYSKRGATFPLGRVGVPKDIAGPVLFYLSEEASWITGDVMVVDGGRLLN